MGSLHHSSVRLLSAIFSTVVLFWISHALAGDEPVPIKEVVSNPDTYHLYQVLLQGTVRDVQPLEPYKIQSGLICYSAYLFRLEDETGWISVAVPGFCGNAIIRDPAVQEGDHVTVHATIQAPGHGGYFLTLEGLRVFPADYRDLQAVATLINPAQP